MDANDLIKTLQKTLRFAQPDTLPGIDTRPESAFYKPLIRPTDSTRVPRDREPRLRARQESTALSERLLGRIV